MIYKLLVRVACIALGIFLSHLYQEKVVTINRVFVEGCQLFPSAFVYQQANKFISKQNFDIKKIQNSIMKLDFVEDCQLKVEYPNTLWINIKERQPVAIHTNKSLLSPLIGQKKMHEIKSLTNYTPPLLKIGGEIPNSDLIQLLKLIHTSEIDAKLCIQVRKGRWDILLNSGKLIKLPSNDIQNGINQLLRFQQNYADDFFRAGTIDLRKPGYALVKYVEPQDLEKWIDSIAA